MSFVNGRDSYVSLHHGQVFEGVTPLLLGFISRPQELDLPLLGFDLVLVLFELLLGSDVRVSHRLEEKETHVKWFLKVLATCAPLQWGGCFTCMALCRLRATRLCENSFWTAEKARENFSSPTCFFSISISSCARFFRVGSGHFPKG